MGEQRIDMHMTTYDVIMALAEGNPGALTVLASLAREPQTAEWDWTVDMLSLDNYNIYGDKIWLLFKDCCGENYPELRDTLRHFRHGIFPVQDVQANLNSQRPIPFLDNKVVKKFAFRGEDEVASSVLYSKDYIESILDSFYKRRGDRPMGADGLGEDGQPAK